MHRKTRQNNPFFLWQLPLFPTETQRNINFFFCIYSGIKVYSIRIYYRHRLLFHTESTGEHMHKKLFFYTVFGILFTSIAGTLLHFVYEWSGNIYWVGLFAPVNESTWEHMKLLFFPMLLYSIFEGVQLRRIYPCICFANAVGIILGTFSIPVIFYTYTGILGTHFLFLDVGTFLCSVILGFLCSYFITSNCRDTKCTYIPYGIVILLLAGFFLFTYHPLNLGIFTS